MPVYDFHCKSCDHAFEELVRLGESPDCPRCGASGPEKLLSAPSAPGRSKAVTSAARRLAASEGHLSNYSRSERNKLLR